MNNKTITLSINSAGVPAASIMGGSPLPFSSGGAAALSSPGTATVMTTAAPKQIIGMVPLLPCDYQDCRDTQSLQCYFNPVFGVAGEKSSTYQNDMNSFFVDNKSSSVIKFIIEKEDLPFFNGKPQNWVTVATVTDTTYGIFYRQGTIAQHPTYLGFTVNWGLVLEAFGPGIYRISTQICNKLVQTAQKEVPSADFPVNITEGTVQIGTLSVPVVYNSSIANVFNYISATISSTEGASASATPGGPMNISGPAGTNIIFKGTAGTPFVYTWGLTGGVLPVETCACNSQSIPFLLRAWNCDMAHGTVKFESWTGGTVGSVDDDGQLFDLCGITIYDSIRMRAFFGYTDFSYDEVMVEWGINNKKPFGQVDRVRDKAIRGYVLKSNLWPQWLHNRFATYAMMSEHMLVSDYNHNNSDYYLKQRCVTKADQAYKPEYLDPKTFDSQHRYINRTSEVKFAFKQGIQGIIKSIMCKTAPNGPSPVALP